MAAPAGKEVVAEEEKAPATAAPTDAAPRTEDGAATPNLFDFSAMTGLLNGDGGWSPWGFNPAMFGGSPELAGAGGWRPDGTNMPPCLPLLYPAPMPAFIPFAPPDQVAQHGGLFAVPLIPIYGPMGGVPVGSLVPLKVTLPSGMPMMMEGYAPATVAAPVRPADAERAQQPDGREGVPVAPNGLRQRHVAPAPPQAGPGQRPEPQRQVRRIRVGFQLDLLLLMKLAVVVFVFNQDGSKDRLLLLLFLAALVYLYQTGALAPFLRWISLSAQRAMMPPPQPAAAVPDVQPAADAQARGGLADAVNPATDAAPAGGAGVVEPVEGGAVNPPPPVNVPPVVPGVEGVRRLPQANWWGFVKEIQMLFVGFVTSLLPGFQHVD